MPPPKPPTIQSLRDLDTADLLAKLRAVREAAGTAEVRLRRGSVHRATLEAFRKEVDEVAGLITGDVAYFHGKPPAAHF